MAPQIDREAALSRADKFAQQGKLRPAIQEYRKVLQHSPADLHVLNTLGDLLLRAGDPQGAAECFEKVGEAYAKSNAPTKAIAVYKKLARINERSIDVQLELAELSCKCRRKREARKFYQNAISLNPAAVTGKRPLAILKEICDIDMADTDLRMELAKNYAAGGFPFEAHEALVNAGREHLRRGDHAGSFAIFREALQLNPGSRAALSALSELLVAQDRADEGVALVKEALDAHPHDADLLVIMGRTYRRLGRLEEAERVFVDLFEVDPTRSEYLFETASQYASNGDLDKALAIAGRCVDIVIKTRTRGKLIALFKQIIAADPDRKDALEQLADIYRRIGDGPGEAATLALLVDQALASGDETQAVILLQKIIRVAPDPEQYRLQLVALMPSRDHDGEELGLEVVDETLTVGDGFQVVEAYESVSFGATATQTAPEEPVAAEDWETAEEEQYVAPEYDPIEERLVTLKDAYVRAGFLDQAESQWLELARHYARRGDDARAKDALYEAFQLNPLTKLSRKRAKPYRQEETSTKASELSKILIVRHFDQCLELEWRRAARNSKPLAMLRIKLDDEGSATEPDPGLEDHVASAIEAALQRPSDTFGRCGGGEFVALLPDTFAEGAAVVAQKIHDQVKSLAYGADDARQFTLSIGVASAAAKRSTPPDVLVKGADRAVRTASESGGDRTVIAGLLHD